MKKFLADTIVKWFKSCGIAGYFRFKILYWAYRLTGWHIRHREWDFVFDYLPPLAKWQNISVLDVGCCRNLFCYELIKRGYKLTGVDIEKYQEDYPGNFMQIDITCNEINNNYDFVTCISVLEHIENGQGIALNNMIKSLKICGRLLITIPTNEFAQGHLWTGFSLRYFESLLPKNTRVIEYTERLGQMCMAIEKTE